MQMDGSGSGLMCESPQRVRRVIGQMTMLELRQQVVRGQAAGRMLARRMPGQTGAQAAKRGGWQALSSGMAPCLRTAAALQKRSAGL